MVVGDIDGYALAHLHPGRSLDPHDPRYEATSPNGGTGARPSRRTTSPPRDRLLARWWQRPPEAIIWSRRSELSTQKGFAGSDLLDARIRPKVSARCVGSFSLHARGCRVAPGVRMPARKAARVWVSGGAHARRYFSRHWSERGATMPTGEEGDQCQNGDDEQDRVDDDAARDGDDQ